MAKKITNSWLKDVQARRRRHAAKVGARTRAYNKKKLRTKSCKYIAETIAGPVGVYNLKEDARARCKREYARAGSTSKVFCKVVKSCVQMR
jgi:hypothetical protein